MVDNAKPSHGVTIHYTVTVSNAGPDNATNVVVNDALPAGLRFVSAAPSIGTYSTSTGMWMIGPLASGATANVVLTATVNSGTDGQTITNTANVHGSELDLHLANNVSSASL